MCTFVFKFHFLLNVSTLVHTQLCCASAKPCQVQNLVLSAPVASQVQKLAGLCRAIISAKPLQVKTEILVLTRAIKFSIIITSTGDNT